LPRARGKRIRELVLKITVSVAEQKVLELDGSDGYTIKWMNLMSLDCIIKMVKVESFMFLTFLKKNTKRNVI
jgi:hypothetical protein